jgi:hypothetical protein
MGYLSNNGTVTVDAILTKKGRELLAKGDGKFRITQFALADDEIDYDLWNPNHGGGSAYYGVVIENTPITEAVPDETQSMKYKLISLPKGTISIPFLKTSDGTTSYSFNNYSGENSIAGINDTGYQQVKIKTEQYTGVPGIFTPNTTQTYTVTILDQTYMELWAAAPTSVISSTISGNSKTISGIPATTTNNNLEILVYGKDKIGQGTKSTKVIITNEQYGSRLVLNFTYSWTKSNNGRVLPTEIDGYLYRSNS